MDLGTLSVDLVIIAVFLGGFALFRSPVTARLGNGVAAAALAMAVVTVVLRHHLTGAAVVGTALAIGTVVGLLVALRVTMLQIPAMVAFQHGAGAVAAFLVSIVELNRAEHGVGSVGMWSGLLGLVLGAATFSASLVAAGKLAAKLKQTPTVLPGHSGLALGLVAVILLVTLLAGLAGPQVMLPGTVLLLVASMVLGVVVAMRVGGADMPVLISFLNAAAGLAAALCGVIIGNRLLIACGATVAASGSILTHVMCRAMNRPFRTVLVGFGGKVSAAPAVLPSMATTAGGVLVPPAADPVCGSPAHDAPSAETAAQTDPLAQAIAAARQARRVIIVPGYGLALAQAQFKLVELSALLESRGASVDYAIHPVAGRMPGHMNVLLAEADVSYDKLLEMDQANPLFPEADLALVVGACDVVNPAAMETRDTPISGMPVLKVGEARRVIVCNLDSRPGYSGVPNTLYDAPNVILLYGNARESLEQVLAGLTIPVDSNG